MVFGSSIAPFAPYCWWLTQGTRRTSPHVLTHPAIVTTLTIGPLTLTLTFTHLRLAKRLVEIDHAFGAAELQPLAFLFGIVFLRLKRELVDMEEVRGITAKIQAW